MFQVVEWNASQNCWIVSHAAHGDEQLCHLRLEDVEDTTNGDEVDANDPSKQKLKIFFSDAETTCTGYLDAKGRITGKVAQLLRPEDDAFSHNATDNDVFVLEPAVGACFTPMVETRVARLARWKVFPAVSNDIFKALDFIQKQGSERPFSVFHKERFKEMIAGIREATRLVSVLPLSREELQNVATAPTNFLSHEKTGPFLWAPGFGQALSHAFAHMNDGAADFANDGDGGRQYDDDDVETVDEGVQVDARFESDDSVFSERRPYASVVGLGFLEQMNMRKEERDWWRLWRSTAFATEMECCATRERARRLKNETFANVDEKRKRVCEERRDGRKHAHHRAFVLLRRQHALLWRTLNGSDMSPNLLNEVVGAQARALRQSEFRLRVAYQLFDEGLRFFENRITGESIDKRCFLVPDEGPQGLKDALPNVDVAKAAEDPCTICADCVNPGETLCALDCGHAFHAECVKPWLLNNRSCPNCRVVVEENTGDDDEEKMEQNEEEMNEDMEQDLEQDMDDFRDDADGINPFGMTVFDHMMRALSGEGVPRGFPMPMPRHTFDGYDGEDIREEYDEEYDDSDVYETDHEDEDPDVRQRYDDANDPSGRQRWPNWSAVERAEFNIRMGYAQGSGPDDRDTDDGMDDDQIPDLVESSDESDDDVPDLGESSEEDAD